MSATVLIPLAVFLINETTRDLYVLPPEAAAQIEGARPCAPIKASIAATTFTSATLDQMCTALAQGLVPKLSQAVKTNWSVDHAKAVGTVIRALQSAPVLRADAPVWPPEIPLSLTGLTASSGATMVFGVKLPEKQPAAVERIDVWSSIDDRFTRTYWSRSMNDPMYLSSQARIIARMGSYIQRAWKGAAPVAAKPNMLKILVDKKISEREISIIENVVKAFSKGNADAAISPVDVRKEGIVYETSASRAKQAEVLARLTRELPSFRAQNLPEGAADISVMLVAPN